MLSTKQSIEQKLMNKICFSTSYTSPSEDKLSKGMELCIINVLRGWYAQFNRSLSSLSNPLSRVPSPLFHRFIEISILPSILLWCKGIEITDSTCQSAIASLHSFGCTELVGWGGILMGSHFILQSDFIPLRHIRVHTGRGDKLNLGPAQLMELEIGFLFHEPLFPQISLGLELTKLAFFCLARASHLSNKSEQSLVK